jgi:hypothetical protein
MKKISILMSAFLITFSYCVNSFSAARLMPTKIFLSDKDRSFKVSLKHKGNEPKWYTIKTVFYRMQEDGKMVKVDKPKEEERSAQKLVRFSPKRVFLKKDQEQIIRISIRKKRNLKEGEYRAHLYVVEDELGKQDQNAASGFKMNLYSRVAVAIPILYRVGKVEPKAEFKEIKLTDGKEKPGLEFSLVNQGDTFLFGTVEAYFTPKGESQKQKLLFVRGVSSYIKERKIKYDLDYSATKLPQGELEVIYREDDLRGGSVIQSKNIAI